MNQKEKIKNNLNEEFDSIKQSMLQSFEYIKKNPEDRKEVINLWKGYIKKLLREATVLSEKYKDKGIIKAVTKMLMFGR